jgi:hypothetical protein
MTSEGLKLHRGGYNFYWLNHWLKRFSGIQIGGHQKLNHWLERFNSIQIGGHQKSSKSPFSISQGLMTALSQRRLFTSKASFKDVFISALSRQSVFARPREF